MAAKTSIPGYGGYIPKYQIEYPLNKVESRHKYGDVDATARSLTSDSEYNTMYRTTVDPATLRPAYSRKPSGEDSDVMRRFRRQLTDKESMENTKRLSEYESKPSNNWGTSYGMQYDGWKQDRELRERQLRGQSAPQTSAHSMDNRPSTNVLQDATQKTSYTRSFGVMGHDPRNHYVQSDGKAVISKRGTTSDLFRGGNKGTARIPGYAGYVPRSLNNTGTLRNNIPNSEKSNLIANYLHAMPHYTGRVPGQRRHA